MSNDLEPTQIVTLDDGRSLDSRQSAAVLMHVRDGLKGSALAKAAGYSSEATVNGFLRSELGRMGVQAAARIVLADAGAVGLQTVIKLAKGAKSEKVKLDAAELLMRGAGLITEDGQAKGGKLPAGTGISISISLNGAKPQEQQGIIDVTPEPS
jgi:hypothetical protein